ncbi:MAG TPA: protein kinase [Candidatus Bathyarchaeia archaeon]|nr:protein kinase [Candidatus Bathyarchaeia archaeon]
MPDIGCVALPSIGATLSHYRITDKLGAGGMGVVYRARDLRLERDVAVKILLQETPATAHSVTRFHREARALAALNHPNIAAIYGFEEFGSSGALVMELVEGSTLAERLAQGPLPLKQALTIARQIAEALECAHERGIIHRDLKPGNVKLKDDDTVKVLDFGLARFLDPDRHTESEEPPTTHSVSTSEPGAVVGTLAYMSPEQARGAKGDVRTDIWAFGVVLYEMLSGQRAFHRATSSDCIAAIIKEDPDWVALPAHVPGAILRLLRHCLAKEPHDRLHSISDARLEIEETLEGTSAVETPAVRRPFHHPSLMWTLVVLATVFAVGTGVLMGWFAHRSQAALKVSERFSILLPQDAPMAPASAMPLAVGRSSLALSPDGSHLAYVALVKGETVLVVRDMQRGDYHQLPGTEGAHSPFFSPDGHWVGFFAHDKLKKASTTGDPSITLCDATLGFGGSWAPDGQIYFSTDYSSKIFKVDDGGGAPLTATGKGWEMIPSMFPDVLPDGRSVLFSTQISFLIGALDLRSQVGTVVLRGGTFPRYLPTGHILFARRGTVQIVPFDVHRLRVQGPPALFVDNVRTERDGAAQFTVSKTGTLVFAAGSDGAVGSLVSIDRNGNQRLLQAPPGDYSAFRISPGGTRVAIPVNTSTGADIWLYNMISRTTTRLTSDNQSSFPVWSPDGSAIYYMSWHDGTLNLYRKPIAGGETLQVTHWQSSGGAPLVVSRDRKWLLTGKNSRDTREDLTILKLGDDGRAVEEIPFLATNFSECLADVSPNGRWAAYTSDESGGWEVYVTSFPHAGEKYRISSAGGEEPLWSPDGRELYFRFGTRWFVADVTTGDRFTAGHPRELFAGPFANLPGYSYAVMPDGNHFLVVEGVDQSKTVTELNVVTNIFDEIRRRTDSAQK